MQASFGSDGEITAKGAGAHPGTAEGLGGVNIKGDNDPKAQIDGDKVGRNVETDASSEPITTGRAPIGYDAVGEVVTMEDPGRGNTKNASGNATSAGNPKNALPGQTGK